MHRIRQSVAKPEGIVHTSFNLKFEIDETRQAKNERGLIMLCKPHFFLWAITAIINYERLMFLVVFSPTEMNTFYLL